MELNLTLEDKLSELHEAGFFISPAIMPYPFSVLANPNKSAQEFISTLIEYFNASTLKAMVNEWSHLPAWNDRLIIHECAASPKRIVQQNGRYLSSFGHPEDAEFIQ